MDKSPEAFRTISEVADELDLPQHVLRFWETKFSSIRPMKRGGGRRYYRPEEVELLRGIRHLLYTEGYTIKGVQKILREQGQRYVAGCWREGDDDPPHAETRTEPSVAPRQAEQSDPAPQQRREPAPSASRPAQGSPAPAPAQPSVSAPALSRAEVAQLRQILDELRDVHELLAKASGRAG